MFPSHNSVPKAEEKQMSLETYRKLVEAGEIAHATLHALPKEVAEGYLPHLNILSEMIQKGKRIHEK